MKKSLRIALTMLIASGAIAKLEAKYDTDHAVSHSYFAVHPMFQSGTPLKESLFRDDRREEKECGKWGAIELALWGGKSRKGDELARYFTPFGKSTLLVTEKNAENVADRDIDATHLNIATSDEKFESYISFCPEQKFFGVGLDWRQTIKRDDDGCAKFWMELSVPLMKVKNTMGLSENIINEGGTLDPEAGLDDAPHVNSVIAAFKQSNWIYGKMVGYCNCDNNCSDCDSCCSYDCCDCDYSCGDCNTSCNTCCSDCDCCEESKMERTRIADIEFKLGWNTVDCGSCRLDNYIGLVIPGGNKPGGHYVFESVVGNGRHFGVMWGAEVIFDIWECEDHLISFAWAWNNRYLFKNNQMRSFDMYDKQWSRYMEMYVNKDQATEAQQGGARAQDIGTSGINVLTKCMEVTPRYSFNMTSAFLYNKCNFDAEFGWSLYGQQAEKVELECAWEEGPAFKAYDGAGETSKARTIDQSFDKSDIPLANYETAILKETDINFNSAAHPAVVSGEIYGALGYTWSDRCYPTFAGLGGSYEFAATNTILHRWTLWGKLGICF